MFDGFTQADKLLYSTKDSAFRPLPPLLPDAPLLTTAPAALVHLHLDPDDYEPRRDIGLNFTYSFIEVTPDLPCPNNCTGHGTCSSGRCACAFGYFGLDCGRTHCLGREDLTDPSGPIAVRATACGSVVLVATDLTCHVLVGSRGALEW